MSFSDRHVETQHASLLSALADALLLPASPLKTVKTTSAWQQRQGATAPPVHLLPQPACRPDQTLPAGFRRPPRPFLTCFLSLLPSAEGAVVAYIFSRTHVYCSRSSRTSRLTCLTSAGTAAVYRTRAPALTCAAATVAPKPPRRLHFGSMILYFVRLFTKSA